MADISASYSRTDKVRVTPLVAALEAEGWSVWWDPEITLVPVRFDSAKLPIDFRAVHTTDLDGWGDDPEGPRLGVET